ncbi:hypothetical protein DPEC_G00178530 [Dallia pectoralis]|uniref:Uncharacterized protein n=1 Tax=Dallia pectoralis TaxID=75939 RepID=A0ACC2GEZ9_DALPE|nr:hypothetical protein DPEC_G00178530 [Dallia pectoralis]
MMTFVAILIYMGIAELPSIDDYWAMETRVSQVANLMSSKRFKLLKRVVHFNNNAQIPGQTTLEAHSVPLTPEQQLMGVTSQAVSVLASTMSSSSPKNIFADQDSGRYLKSKNCRYTGTVSQSDNRTGNAPPRPIKEMMKKAVPRGTCDYITSDDGILMVRWKDNKVVTLMSTDIGVEPWSSIYRYCSDTKRKEQVSCPYLIKSYNANMGGIDKSNMLVHLYRTLLRAKLMSASLMPGKCIGVTARLLV